MASFVIDIWIAFLIRTAINAWKKLESARWSVLDGNISDYRYIRPSIGCDYGQYSYTYAVKGRVFEGIHADPYFVSRSKNAEISSSVGASVRVMDDPNDPARSVLTGF
jgi:hypothetical protein